MAMINVSFTVDKKDVVALACHYYETSSMVKAVITKARVALAVMLTSAGTLVLISPAFKNVHPLGVGLIISAGILAAIFPKLYRAQLRRSAERFVTECSYQRALGKYSLALSEDRVESITPLGESK